ncbi:MAG: hypothetical protein ABSB35_18885 [Bryobacteraceae bacterium]|jgi:hypothetical protein
MTEQTFENISADIRRAASESRVNLDDPVYPFTVWLENPIGSGTYFNAAKCRDLEDAKRQSGSRNAIIYGAAAGKTQVIVWRDHQWIDAFAK